MANQSFDDFVNQQADSSAQEEIDWAAQLQEWKDYLNEFYSKIEGFLKPYIDSNKLILKKNLIRLEEEYIGTYTVHNLEIKLGDKKITLTPIGTLLIGAKGRIDMEGPRGKVRFVLVAKKATEPQIKVRIKNDNEGLQDDSLPNNFDWSWKIATPPPRISYIEFEKESFQAALMEVVNG